MKYAFVGLFAACLGVTTFFITTDPLQRNVQTIPGTLTGPFHTTNTHIPFDQPSKRIQVALLLDTSNSMDGLIDQARSQLWKMVNELAAASKDEESASLEIALYQYGNDGLSMRNGYVQQILPLTTDLDAVSEALFELTTNGGSEYAPWTIVEAATDMDWTDEDGALRIAVIAGNEDFAQGSVTVQQACEAAALRDISVNPVFCGDYRQGIQLGWKQMDCTGGTYLNIDHNDKVAHVPTPYDAEVIALNARLNATYIGYGNDREVRIMSQMTQDANAMSVAPANARTRAFAKSKKVYKNANWDLVDYAEAEPAAVADIAAETLPDTLRAMDSEARVAFVQQKAKERAAIQQQLLAMEKKVNAYIAEQQQQANEGKTLDNVLIGTIREQATRNGFSFH